MKEQLTKKEIIPIGLILAAILAGIWFYPSLPDEMAIHWNIHNEPDDWGSKFMVVSIPLIICVLTYLILTLPSKLPFKMGFISKYKDYLFKIKIFAIVFILYIYTSILLPNLGYVIPIFVDTLSMLILFVIFSGWIGISLWRGLWKEKLKMDLLELKEFLILLGASIFGILCSLSYTLTLQRETLDTPQKEILENLELPISLHFLIILQLIQSIIVFAIIIFIGLRLAKKVGLGLPIIEEWLRDKRVGSQIKTIVRISVPIGVILAGILMLLDVFIFMPMSPQLSELAPSLTPPVYQGLLASFYGGLTEEILCRFFFMTLLVWLFAKLWKTKEKMPTDTVVWLAIILSALLFAVGHLPITASIVSLTPAIIVRAFVLNGIAGIAFGYLYWRKGLESAMVAHFSTDIGLHVILPLFT